MRMFFFAAAERVETVALRSAGGALGVRRASHQQARWGVGSYEGE